MPAVRPIEPFFFITAPELLIPGRFPPGTLLAPWLSIMMLDPRAPPFDAFDC